MKRIEREEHRRHREDQEAEVEHSHAPDDVAESPEANDEHGCHEQVAHENPEQVAHVARSQGIDMDAAKDRRQRDQDDGGVDRRHEHAERGVRQGDPLVAIVI